MKYVSRIVLVVVLSLIFVIPQTLSAQAQAVTAAELRDAVKQSAAVRERNLEQVRSFFGNPAVREALADAHIDSKRVEKAVSTLNSSELAQVAAQTSQIQNDFAAGALTTQELTYIVIALAAAVLVLIVVAA
jgi:hypothetical protein